MSTTSPARSGSGEGHLTSLSSVGISQEKSELVPGDTKISMDSDNSKISLVQHLRSVPNPSTADSSNYDYYLINTLELYDKIDTEALASIASKLANKAACVAPGLAFGSFNIVIRITFEDGSPSWMCRIPKKGSLFAKENEEMLAESLHSTVSTMRYVAAHTSIPLPEIYGYCFTSDNPAKTPYLFMEEFHDTVSLYEVLEKWDDSDIESVMYQWAYHTMELAKLQFPQIGMLHLDLDSPNPIKTAEIKRCLVPSTIEKDAQKVEGYRGPYVSTADYLLGLSDFKKALYYKAPGYDWGSDPEVRKTYLEFYLESCKLESLIPFYLDRRYQTGPFVLTHYDFNMQNILVRADQPGKVVGVIDWDYISAMPIQSFFLTPRTLTLDINPAEVNRAESAKIQAKKWRDVYCNAIIAASEYLEFDFPVKELIGGGTAYGRLVDSLTSFLDEMEYHSELDDYVYGSSWLPKLETSHWTQDFLKKVGLDIDLCESMDESVATGIKEATDSNTLQEEPKLPPTGKKSLAKRFKAFIRRFCF